MLYPWKQASYEPASRSVVELEASPQEKLRMGDHVSFVIAEMNN